MGTKLPLFPRRLGLQCTRCSSKLQPALILRHFASLSGPRKFSTSRIRPAIAAPEIDFSQLPPPNPRNARITPASPSYFTGKPDYTDDLLALQTLLRKYQTLPVIPGSQAPRVAWRTINEYNRELVIQEIKSARYHRIVEILRRLNRIHPALMPDEVKLAIEHYKRDINPHLNVPKPGVIDEWGRAYGVGRRKTSSAKVYLVEGDGQVLINGKSLNAAFARVHDRESALWALKITRRIDKYNVWALVTGGGLTGQAESITLGLARALMVHEPALKPALRRGESTESFSKVSIWIKPFLLNRLELRISHLCHEDARILLTDWNSSGVCY
ncbi:37S ribosomal protein S9, mitochondrial [Loxospora ochrophaea]|nr:37S ribosomal protein S9, mitochondrial [Loxospora ochrophaea]